MGWTIDQGIDVTSAFQGITTPLRELYDEIHQRGWDVTKVDTKDGQFVATVKNPHGEAIEKVGPNPQTAVGHCLIGIMRQETMRYRMAAWDNTWEDKLAEIAQGYADANAYDPKAASAWKELAQDSEKRAEAIANQIRVELTHEPHPYKDVNEMADDIRNKQKIQVSRANTSHPLWTEDQVLAYRLVHDVLGHAQVGGDWGWHGENGATAAHMPLLSPEAQRALFTEAIGQAAYNHFYRDVGPQKIVFLDDHLQNIQDTEGAAGHGGVHPSQTVVPMGIPEIPEGGEEKTSAYPTPWTGDIEPWEWGHWGKGYIDPDSGELIHWKTTPPEAGDLIMGDPHHTEVAAKRMGLPDHQDVDYDGDLEAPITIAPNGQYVSSRELNAGEAGDGTEDRFEQEITPMRWVDKDAWIAQNSGGSEMGHGPHIASANGLDPNHGWASGIEPLPDNAYLWQREDSGLDPLNHAGVKDVAHKVHPNWFELEDHNGLPDLDSQRQAVVNAFRSTLLQPRQTPRWGATHYQHIQHIPATVSDPLRFADALNSQREAHNKARGLPEGIHRAVFNEELSALKGWIKGTNPSLDDAKVDEVARRELFHMIAEEEERITGEDPGGQLLPMEIADIVGKDIKKRLAVLTKSSVDQKFDFGKDRLFHKSFNAPDPGIYGDFLHSHVRSLAGVGLHADDIARAAREDVANHGGKGHHFRAQVSDLIPGVGPREISHAWMLLQPHTSQLGVISPSVAETLGYDPEKEIHPRDYFKMERQLAAGRDASGYTHVPLGQFSWGMHDRANYGHGVHRDLSPFAAINPTPYDQVDWTQYPGIATQDWDDPYWWNATEPNRDEVGQQWDQMVAVKHPKHEIPYRTAAAPEETPVQPEGVRTPFIMHPESGEMIVGEPTQSAMQHAKNSLGLSTEEIWAMDPEVGKQ